MSLSAFTIFTSGGNMKNIVKTSIFAFVAILAQSKPFNGVNLEYATGAIVAWMKKSGIISDKCEFMEY
jgi:hypothetical protein